MYSFIEYGTIEEECISLPYRVIYEYEYYPELPPTQDDPGEREYVDIVDICMIIQGVGLVTIDNFVHHSFDFEKILIAHAKREMDNERLENDLLRISERIAS